MRDLDVDDFVLQPFSEAGDAFLQLSPGLEARIGDGKDIDFGEGMADERAQVLRKISECVITAFEAVDEDEEKGFPHAVESYSACLRIT